MCDETEIMELMLLRLVYEKSEALVRAKYWDDPDDEISDIEKEHEAATDAMREWYYMNSTE